MGGYHQDSRIALPMTIMSTDGVEDVYLILLSLVPVSVHNTLDIYVDLEEYRDTGM